MSIPNPTTYVILNMKKGEAAIDFNTNISSEIIERILGGKEIEEKNILTNIEKKLFKHISKKIIKQLNKSWNIFENNKEIFDFFKIFNNPNEHQITNENEIVIMCVLEIIIGNKSGMINICYPIINLEKETLEVFKENKYNINQHQKKEEKLIHKNEILFKTKLNNKKTNFKIIDKRV
jgi:flagellar motor switch protein FliM